ncbi:MAG: sensor histidine kinase [Candidatus Dactylopiibacterium sp.]|nr:sensor histidine kinase [Candidatus Dactylopiibacterium sp.]
MTTPFLSRLHGVRRKIVLLSLPWVVLLIVLALAVDQIAIHNMRQPIEDALHDQVVRGRQVLSRRLAVTFQDVRFLATLPALTRLLDGDATARSQVTEIFQHYSRLNARYSQIRWLDETGWERIRVDRGKNGTFLVPVSQLQDKSNRPYFQSAHAMPREGTFLSRFDLNIENDQIEVPYNPTFRVAAAVFDSQGVRRGVIVLNVVGADILKLLSDVGGMPGSRLELLDGAGFWIMGPTPEDEWGFMLGHPEHTLAQRHPARWKWLNSDAGGVYQDAQGAWVSAKLKTDESGTDATFGEKAALNWSVLVHLPAGELRQRELPIHLATALLAGLAVLLALWVMARLALTQQDREHAFAELQRRTTELTAAHDALLKAFETQRAMQRELVRAERLSSLGLMVAGVAHELNTPLGSALVTISSLARAVSQLEALVKDGLRRSDLEAFLRRQQDGLPMVQHALERAATLVQRFKQLAVDRETEERRTFALHEVVRDSLHLIIRRQAGQHQKLVLEIPEDLTLDSYPGPLGQVVDNLVGNAFTHAFPDGFAGVVTLSARLDATRDTVTLTVHDTGRGIPEEVRPRVFDLFFTTRRHAGGTGLGLFLAHQITHDILGGVLKLEDSGEQGGTLFALVIPVVAPAAR